VDGQTGGLAENWELRRGWPRGWRRGRRVLDFGEVFLQQQFVVWSQDQDVFGVWDYYASVFVEERIFVKI